MSVTDVASVPQWLQDARDEETTTVRQEAGRLSSWASGTDKLVFRLRLYIIIDLGHQNYLNQTHSQLQFFSPNDILFTQHETQLSKRFKAFTGYLHNDMRVYMSEDVQWVMKSILPQVGRH